MRSIGVATAGMENRRDPKGTAIHRVLSLLLLALPVAAFPADIQYRDLRCRHPVPAPAAPQTVTVDVRVHGDSPASVAAAVQAARMGRSVALFAFDHHIGGMTTGAPTWTDLGNQGSIGGITRESYDRPGRWADFSCSAAEDPLLAMLRESRVSVAYEHRHKQL